SNVSRQNHPIPYSGGHPPPEGEHPIRRRRGAPRIPFAGRGFGRTSGERTSNPRGVPDPFFLGIPRSNLPPCPDTGGHHIAASLAAVAQAQEGSEASPR